MPKENQKRGRREEKKRKREQEEGDHATKRQKSEDVNEDEVEILVNAPEAIEQNQYGLNLPGELPFYGLLNDDEQEYFKRADTLLELNQFSDAEERSLFLANVWREADGKELKIASSQSCSRLMERLILMSPAAQLKILFQKFNGHFLHLVQHRFASHCCETLFLKAAQAVTDELVASPTDEQPLTEDGKPAVSMEDLYLSTVTELQDSLGYLMTDPFASHALRVLLLVLSGRPLATKATASVLQSKKKENINVTGIESDLSQRHKEMRAVPESFKDAIARITAGTVAGLDTTSIHALATHPTANPVLQLLIELELTQSGKQKAKDENSLFRRLLPDDPPAEGTLSAAFINGLMYETVGSRLLEVLVRFAPGKAFKSIYRSSFRDRLGLLAKNEIAAFVVGRVLERMSKEDLEDALLQICPHVEILVQRSRTTLIKILIERCIVREISTEAIADALRQAYGAEPAARLFNMLKLNVEHTNVMARERQLHIEAQDAGKLHGSLLAQAMMAEPGPLRTIISDSLLVMDAPTLLLIAKDRTATHVLQKSLTCPRQTTAFRRKIIQQFFDQIADLALDSVGSHVIDSFWSATAGLQFVRERIAKELSEKERMIKDSFSGRAVWRNWMMDLYKRRRTDWISKVKDVASQTDRANGENTAPKSGIEFARQKYAMTKTGKQKRGKTVVAA